MHLQHNINAMQISQCKHMYIRMQALASSEWHACFQTENVLCRRNVCALGGISLKLYSTTNILTTVLLGLNKVCKHNKVNVKSYKIFSSINISHKSCTNYFK